MKMSKDRLLVVILVPALVIVGALAFRGRPAGDSANAASPPPPTPPRPLALAPAAQAKNPVKTAAAELTKLGGDIQVVGTVTFHEDHFAVVGPLVPGRISRVSAGVGDKVKRGQVIAEIESSDVGQARAELVSAKARFAAADANLKRETDLAEKKISSSREQELARAQWETERAGVRAAIMRLRAIGLSPADIEEAEKHDLGGRVQMRADQRHGDRAQGDAGASRRARDRRLQHRRHVARLGDPGPVREGSLARARQPGGRDAD
jgi:multidrug efflux pump subunit AcrA (membrane-fusion protein)